MNFAYYLAKKKEYNLVTTLGCVFTNLELPYLMTVENQNTNYLSTNSLFTHSQRSSSENLKYPKKSLREINFNKIY